MPPAWRVLDPAASLGACTEGADPAASAQSPARCCCAFPGGLGRGEDTRTRTGREVMLRRGAASTWDVDTSKGSEMEAIYKCL